jgi:predicted aspartyl protease
VKTTRFDPKGDLIIVGAKLWGPRGEKKVTLAFDTAATETHLIPDILDDLGYSPRDGEQVTIVRSAIGSERGYMTRVARFSALGFTCNDFRLHVHDLPEGIGIDGLLGLSFLKQFDYSIKSAAGRILVERSATSE